MALTKTPIELSSTPGIVDNSNDTAITIDASENVLVGKTSAGGVATVGAEFRGSDGYVISTASSDKSGWFGRNTSDGAIVGFYKDGTDVGSIGVDNNDNFQIGATTSGHGGLYFDNGSISPMAGNSRVQDTLDLGNATYRFKDLYLSGGAYLGGTAAANKLEDYEEGTWTPTDGSGAGLALGATNNRYTKVGRLVVASVRLTFPTTSSTATAQVVLPFTVDSNAVSSVSGGVCTEQSYDADITLTASIDNNTRVIFRKRGVGALTNANLSGKILRFTVTYQAA